MDAQILSLVRQEHGSGVRSLETVAGSGHRLVRVEGAGASEHLILGGRVADKVAKQHWRPVLHGILNFVVAFGARPCPLYGCMNLEGIAVAVEERSGPVSERRPTRAPGRSREVGYDIESQFEFEPFDPESGAS